MLETSNRFVIYRFADFENLLLKPRVSSKISEYVLDFLIDNVSKPHKLHNTDKFKYEITLHFSYYTPDKKYFVGTFFDTDDDKFTPHLYRTSQKVVKEGNVFFCSKRLDRIANIEYANIVYDMISCLWLSNHKRAKHEHFEQAKSKLDYELIDSFTYPAPFDEQHYMLDGLTEYKSDKTNWEPINFKEYYIKHFGF